jgi:hypothetical protein
VEISGSIPAEKREEKKGRGNPGRVQSSVVKEVDSDSDKETKAQNCKNP